MNITYKTKKCSEEKHIYSFIARLTKNDFASGKDIIKEVVLKIKVLPFLTWSSDNKIKKSSEVIKGEKYTVFEIRREGSLYPQDMPFEIVGPESDIGEISYSVTNDNFHNYFIGYLLWELYGDNVLAQKEKKKLDELQEF